VVIDNGSGYTKVGYSGNVKPDYVFPTAIAAADEGGSEISGSSRDGLRDLDFSLGDLVRIVSCFNFLESHSTVAYFCSPC